MSKLLMIWGFSASLVLSTSAANAGDSGDESDKPDNHLALFLGVTHAEEDSAAPTVGLDYERRVSERLGVGVVFRDHASGDIDATLYAVSFSIHTTSPLSFVIAPGIEREDGDNSGVLRVGAEYEFEVGSAWSLAPALYFDITEDDTKEVLGVAIGFEF